jgi:hypothetical protein
MLGQEIEEILAPKNGRLLPDGHHYHKNGGKQGNMQNGNITFSPEI